MELAEGEREPPLPHSPLALTEGSGPNVFESRNSGVYDAAGGQDRFAGSTVVPRGTRGTDSRNTTRTEVRPVKGCSGNEAMWEQPWGYVPGHYDVVFADAFLQGTGAP